MEMKIRCRCGERIKASDKIQVCKKCNARIYPVPEWMSEQDLSFQEQRSKRKVRKLDFDVR